MQPLPPRDTTALQTLPANTVEGIVQQATHRINEYQRLEEQRGEHLGSELARLVNCVGNERSARIHAGESINAQLKDHRERVGTALLEQRRARHQVETRLQRVIGEKAAEAREALNEGCHIQEEASRCNREISEEICNLYSSIGQARKFRMEKSNKLAEGVQHKLSEIREAVAAERRIRLDSESTLLELFQQMGERLQGELETSRKERHHATTSLIDVMESVLPRMDEVNKKATTNSENLENMSSQDMASSVTNNFQKRHTATGAGKSMLMFRGSVSSSDTFGA